MSKVRTGIYGLRTPDSNSINLIVASFATPCPDIMRLDPPHVLMEWDDETFEYLTNQLKSAPENFIRTGGTHFIHPRVYTNSRPLLLQSLFILCSIYSHPTELQQGLISEAISHTTSVLMHASASIHTLLSILEFVQALIMLQIITLFTPYSDLSIRSEAEDRLPLLSHWTYQLYHSVPITLPLSLSPYQAWILAESVRRTIHVAHKVQATYSFLTRGYFRLTLFTEALPVNRVSWLWDAEMHENVTEDEVCTKLVSYRELTDGWEKGELGTFGNFEESLLVGCKGVEARITPVETGA